MDKKYYGTDTDEILDIINRAKYTENTFRETANRVEAAIAYEEERLDRQFPNRGWYNIDGSPMTMEQYNKMMKYTEKIKSKSITEAEVSVNKANFFDKAMKIINKNKAVIAGTLATVAIAISTIGPVFGPSLKANIQMTDLSDNFGEKLVKLNYCKQRDNMFSDFKLTISPNKFVNNLGLTADSHMRLYILSTMINDADFESILWELGYNNLESYVKKMGFEHGDFRAVGNYKNEYETKLKGLIMDINKNPEKINEYLEKYPELGFIYDPNNTILTSEGIITTRARGGR